MAELAAQSIGPGDPVEIVRGMAEGLRGRVVRLVADGVRVRVKSWKRTYELTVDRLDLILLKPDV
jgi:ribosomal protein L24